MARILVHIGTHKTGTTTIQRTLEANVESLAAEGIAFLPTTKSLRYAWLHDDDLALRATEARRLRERISQAKAPLTVISDEGLAGTLPLGYQDTNTRAQVLREVLDGHDVSILVYLRRQDTFIESAYTQQIHVGRSLTFRDFRDELPDGSFDWLSLLEDYAAVFGRQAITVKTYDRQRLSVAGGLVSDFAAELGAASLAEVPDASHNVSYSRPALEVARICNPAVEGTEARVRMLSLLQSASATAPFERHGFFITRDEREEFLQRYETSNRRVAREWLAMPEDALFAPVEAADAAPYAGLTLEDAVKTLTFAMLDLDERLRRPELQRSVQMYQQLSRLKRVPLVGGGALKLWRRWIGRG